MLLEPHLAGGIPGLFVCSSLLISSNITNMTSPSASHSFHHLLLFKAFYSETVELCLFCAINPTKISKFSAITENLK